jgi:bifunctional non-homologous end joining protein LigD
VTQRKQREDSRMPLEEYKAKRDFNATPEPSGKGGETEGGLRFVVQEHHARALHYDFRLELDGVLLSWAVPKGPPLERGVKRLAVHVEDHPLDYASFEGTIPPGEYGAGTVEIWDAGTWEPLGDPHAGLAKGDFKFRLIGEKLRGLWVMVRLKPRPGEKRDNWLLIKERDAEDDTAASPPTGVTEAAALSTSTAPQLTANSQAASALSPIPARVELELATLAEKPPSSDGWIAEAKYDGYRLVLAVDGGQARALTRTQADWSDRFPTLTEAALRLPASSAILDGEVVVFDERGISRFEMLRKVLHTEPELVTFVAFDLLYLNGHDLRELPLLRRKELLAELLAEQPDAPLRFAQHVDDDSWAFFASACVSDLEGIVCKRADSTYVAGRTRDWLKIKCRHREEFVVGGHTLGVGSRSDLGALVLGVYSAGRLVYAGRVGSGLSAADVSSLTSRFELLAQDESPFDPPPSIADREVRWVRPEIVVEVEYREWTEGGLLRQPIFLGVREDKVPTEVTRERPDAPGGGSPAPRERKSPQTPSRASGAVLGVRISNPGKLLFPDSPTYSKLDLAHYYAEVAEFMLPEVANRPLTLLRCPIGKGQACFYQRHPDPGLPPHVRRLKHQLGDEPGELLFVDSAEGLVALAQMGTGEIHNWMSRAHRPTRPDRICFDLDPGPEVTWRQLRDAALLLRKECSALGFASFVKSTGGKGLHVIVPIEPVWKFDRVRALVKSFALRLAHDHPETFVAKMAKDVRAHRIYLDVLRNGEGASAAAAYTTRMRPGPTCSLPLAWDELGDDLDTTTFTPAFVLARVAEGTDPWRGLSETAVGATALEAVEREMLGIKTTRGS